MDFDTFPGGKTTTCLTCGHETYEPSSQERVYSMLLPGARKMCLAKGIVFDQKKFEILVASPEFSDWLDMDNYDKISKAILRECGG